MSASGFNTSDVEPIIGVNVLLEEDGAETRVESTNALVLENLAETTNQTVGEARGRDEPDASSLERAESNGGEELGTGGRDGVDGTTVPAGRFEAEKVDGLLLEKLVTAKLEGPLDEITSKGRAEAGQEGTGTFGLDDLAEAANHATVVGSRVELDLGLDAEGISVSNSGRETGGITYTSTGVKAP
jgi:hypothetical protein